MMSNYNKLVNNLEKLKLQKFRENLDIHLNLISEGQKSIVDSLYELTNQELDFKNTRAIKALVNVAGFPFLKRFEDFDFNFQPRH